MPLLISLTLVLSACSATTSPAASASASATVRSIPPRVATDSQSSTDAQSATTYAIKVYFSHQPQSNDHFNAVFPVNRLSPTGSVGTSAIQQLIVGPTAAESAQGYFSEMKNHLVGPSTCTSSTTRPDFTLRLNIKGSTYERGTATLKLCHLFASSGIGTDARASAEMNATLKQFADIKKVVILTKDAHCFGDESGADMCLR
ncbi:MAG: hypothetical protein H0U76_14275 [Ktedonobacteraceae bacterium]|nr:hypothetical protein [Ktedonobacteraceae bacterium]